MYGEFEKKVALVQQKKIEKYNLSEFEKSGVRTQGQTFCKGYAI